jgi:uncharacterized protein YerC
MVNISRKYLEKDLKDKIWTKFQKEIAGAKSNRDLEESLKKFFTPTEISMVEKRLAIINLLQSGFTYRKIGETIDVSPTTINFVRRGFKKNFKIKRKEKYEGPPKTSSKNKFSRYPTFTGKGRWRFLNM